MQTIAIYQNTIQVSPRLQGLKKEIVQAVNSENLQKVLSEKEGFKIVRALIDSYISRAKIISGFNAFQLDDNDRRMLVDEIITTVKKYQWLCVGEIDVIFSEGLRGNLGETFGLTALSVETWIKTYQFTKRTEAMKEQMRFNQEQEKIEDQKKQEAKKNESEKRRKSQINEVINKVRTPTLIEKAVYYDFLDSHGIISINTSTKVQYYKKSLRGLKNDPDLKMKSTDYKNIIAIRNSKAELFDVWVSEQSVTIA